MKRLLLLTAAGLTVVALAGAVGLPDLAGAQDATATPDTITVSGVGTVDAVPNEAQMSFGAETRKPTAQAAVAANADAMRKIINALRQAGGRELATQWVSVYPYTDDTGNVTGYSASNSVSAVSDVGDAPALIDAAAEAGANQINGPGLSSSNAEALYRQALAKAVDAARLNAEALAKAAGRSLGSITAIVEGGPTAPEPMYRDGRGRRTRLRRSSRASRRRRRRSASPSPSAESRRKAGTPLARSSGRAKIPEGVRFAAACARRMGVARLTHAPASSAGR